MIKIQNVDSHNITTVNYGVNNFGECLSRVCLLKMEKLKGSLLFFLLIQHILFLQNQIKHASKHKFGPRDLPIIKKYLKKVQKILDL